jgi:hypothetical protein
MTKHTQMVFLQEGEFTINEQSNPTPPKNPIFAERCAIVKGVICDDCQLCKEFGKFRDTH